MNTSREAIDQLVFDEELTQLTRALVTNLPRPAREETLALLRSDAGEAHLPLHPLAALSLLDDCMRVAHLSVEADGVVEDHELVRVLPLVRVAAPRFFSSLSRYNRFGEVEAGDAEWLDFFRFHRDDPHPFGFANPSSWRGLALCKRVAAISGNDELVRTHERVLTRVMDAVFAGRSSGAERAARDRLRALLDDREPGSVDPRVAAFCRPDAPEVFSSVAHGSQVFLRDPFDVEAIHAEARSVFDSQVEHAIAASNRQSAHGRTLLVLGASGSGKTHLLRAFRSAVHSRRLGYVGYLQMSSDVGEYARYVLAKLVDSLERPLDAPEVTESALLALSTSLAEHGHMVPEADLERLRNGEITSEEMPRYVGSLVDRLLRTSELAEVESDIVQALLLLQRRDPAIQRRVVKFLRCEPLTSHEQTLVGGLAPHTQPEDPERMILALGRLAYALDRAALVLLVDQIEDATPDEKGLQRVQTAIDVVRRIADALPSSVIVIACLEDVYDTMRSRLHQSTLDRLEREPPPVRLSARRSRDEIEAMLVLRLQHLYDALDAAWRSDDPFFPFRAEQIDELSNQRARDCLSFFHKAHSSAIAAGTIVEPDVAPPRLTAPPVDERVDLERAWNDASVASSPAADNESEILALVAGGLRAAAREASIATDVTFRESPRPHLVVRIDGHVRRVVEVCNRPPQGGRLGKQIESLRSGVTPPDVPVALRTSEFSFGPTTAIAKTVGAFLRDGGHALYIDEAELRALSGFERFAAAHANDPTFGAWCSSSRPVGRWPAMKALLSLDSLPRSTPLTTSARPVTERPPPPAQLPTAPTTASPKAWIHLGTAPTMRAEPVSLEVETLKVHGAFLGTTGSGKTTVALRIIEQLLERGVSALFVDRKGDLARYASPEWWDAVPSDPAVARRKQELRERVRVDLYTPGDATGRPIQVPIIPPGMREMSSQERDQIAGIAASGLAAMMDYGRGESHRKRVAILKKAIELQGSVDGAGLDQLRETISRPDPELIAAVGDLTRHFATLGEDLDVLGIQRRSLVEGGGEPLDVASMLEPRDGRARLAIISAHALGDDAALQLFVSRIMVDLARMVRRTPRPNLHAVAFFDEADKYIPANSNPATKDPMFDLLRRARSGGLGVLLATQNPGDIDYKARDNIQTWLIGKVAQDRAIEKMRNLIGAYPNVASRLATQTTGSFFLLNPSVPNGVRELRAEPALMKTEQIEEQEIAALARATKKG